MRSTIRNIGNSKGIILSKDMLKQCFISDTVNIEVIDNSIVITPFNDKKRLGWAEAFKKMAENKDDLPLTPDFFQDDDLSEWTWQ